MRIMRWSAALLPAVLFVGIGVAQDAKGDAAAGKAVFDTRCSLCHLADSTDKKIGPGLQGVKNGKLPSGKDATHDNLMENLNKGGGGMPAFEKLLSAEEKENVVAYVLTL